jgi:hypothetical protein
MPRFLDYPLIYPGRLLFFCHVQSRLSFKAIISLSATIRIRDFRRAQEKDNICLLAHLLRYELEISEGIRDGNDALHNCIAIKRCLIRWPPRQLYPAQHQSYMLHQAKAAFFFMRRPFPHFHLKINRNTWVQSRIERLKGKGAPSLNSISKSED